MALRGDLLVLKIDDAVIAESTDVSLDLSAEALETTSQTSGLNATFIQGKVSGTASGSFLLASDGANFTTLFTEMNAGTTFAVTVERNSTEFIDCDGVITSLSLSGGLSDSLATGSYSIQLSGNPATA
jgi:hypothetical protein